MRRRLVALMAAALTLASVGCLRVVMPKYSTSNWVTDPPWKAGFAPEKPPLEFVKGLRLPVDLRLVMSFPPDHTVFGLSTGEPGATTFSGLATGTRLHGVLPTFSPTGSFAVVTAGEGGTLVLACLDADGTLLSSAPIPGARVNSLTWCPGGRWILAVTEGAVLRYSAPSLALEHRVALPSADYYGILAADADSYCVLVSFTGMYLTDYVVPFAFFSAARSKGGIFLYDPIKPQLLSLTESLSEQGWVSFGVPTVASVAVCSEGFLLLGQAGSMLVLDRRSYSLASAEGAYPLAALALPRLAVYDLPPLALSEEGPAMDYRPERVMALRRSTPSDLREAARQLVDTVLQPSRQPQLVRTDPDGDGPMSSRTFELYSFKLRPYLGEAPPEPRGNYKADIWLAGARPPQHMVRPGEMFVNTLCTVPEVEWPSPVPELASRQELGFALVHVEPEHSALWVGLERKIETSVPRLSQVKEVKVHTLEDGSQVLTTDTGEHALISGPVAVVRDLRRQTARVGAFLPGYDVSFTHWGPTLFLYERYILYVATYGHYTAHGDLWLADTESGRTVRLTDGRNVPIGTGSYISAYVVPKLK